MEKTTIECCGKAGAKCVCATSNVCHCAWKCKCVDFGIGKPAPYFETTAYYNGFKNIKLTDYKGKYLVLFFYPLDFTFVCPTEICQFSDRVQEFRDIGCEVVACSVDSQFSHMEYCKKDRKKGGLGKMNIPLLSDLTKTIAKRYQTLAENGDVGATYRSTYIIDRDQNLRQFSISDFPVGRNVDEVLRLVKAFQYTDEFGEVCPAQWQPGKATMHANPDSSKTTEYWEKEHGK